MSWYVVFASSLIPLVLLLAVIVLETLHRRRQLGMAAVARARRQPQAPVSYGGRRSA